MEPKPHPTPAHVAALFPALGLEPRTTVYLLLLRDRPCGCAVGALLCEAAGGLEAARAAADTGTGPHVRMALAARTGWSEDFVAGISNGFFGLDRAIIDVARRAACPDYAAGADLGLAAHALVFPAGNRA